jgi:required for meiotic nuclear division protein 1
MLKQVEKTISTGAQPGLRHARALFLADRLTIDRSGRSGVVSTAPFCFQSGEGYVAVFRYGAVILIGLPREAEAAALAQFSGQVSSSGPIDEERVDIELLPDQDEGPSTNGTIRVRELTVPHVLVLADVLAKSVALARYEKDIASVFDTIEPAANTLATKGRIPKNRKALLQLVGSALLAQHRVSGRIAFAEKPDILWEHPELGRFYDRLEDEYEIIERGVVLNGKMGVIATAAETFTDMIDTARSARLELLIVVLILAELVIAAFTLFRH